MSLGLKMRAAEVGMVFWKKLRSSTFMARFTGGANMSSVAAEDIEISEKEEKKNYLLRRWV
jgi:hypothetical protein